MNKFIDDEFKIMIISILILCVSALLGIFAMISKSDILGVMAGLLGGLSLLGLFGSALFYIKRKREENNEA